jgi:RNA polymerase sigma factor (sigma-70 family)
MGSNSRSESCEIHLWKACQKGDAKAFSELYELLIQDLLRYGHRVTSDHQLIRDSIQDLFLHLWRRRETLTDTDSVKFYLYRSLRNRIVRNLPRTISPPADMTTAEFPIETLWIEHESAEIQIERLRKALTSLPRRQQEAIQLRYYHDFTPEEIGAIMEINTQSVRNLLHRAILHLREALVFFLILFVFLSKS